MIRRWTCVNLVNSNWNSLTSSSKPIFFIALKKNVRYKKLIFMATRRRRKRITIRKRRSSWLIYNQIFSRWSIDYRDKKAIFRFQYANQIFTNNALVVDPLLFKKPILHETIVYDADDYITAHIPPKLYKYLTLLSFPVIKQGVYSSKIFFNEVRIFYHTIEISPKTHTTLFFNHSREGLYPLLNNFKDDLIKYEELSFTHLLNYVTELYKLISLLTFYGTYKSSPNKS